MGSFDCYRVALSIVRRAGSVRVVNAPPPDAGGEQKAAIPAWLKRVIGRQK
jgi:hypothetical protein